MTATATKERPILFSAPMVRAILDGTKTQTRRERGLGLPNSNAKTWRLRLWDSVRAIFADGRRFIGVDPAPDHVTRCPYGVAGDRLWVRETIAVHSKPCEGQGIGYVLQFRADNAERELDPDTRVYPHPDIHPHQKIADKGWRPSIHMPRWACRIVLEITDVRVERLQAITDADAKAEGVTADGRHGEDYFPGIEHVIAYGHLWDEINGDGAWDLNHWVWAISFRRVTP